MRSSFSTRRRRILVVILATLGLMAGAPLSGSAGEAWYWNKDVYGSFVDAHWYNACSGGSMPLPDDAVAYVHAGGKLYLYEGDEADAYTLYFNATRWGDHSCTEGGGTHAELQMEGGTLKTNELWLGNATFTQSGGILGAPAELERVDMIVNWKGKFVKSGGSTYISTLETTGDGMVELKANDTSGYMRFRSPNNVIKGTARVFGGIHVHSEPTYAYKASLTIDEHAQIMADPDYGRSTIELGHGILNILSKSAFINIEDLTIGFVHGGDSPELNAVPGTKIYIDKSIRLRSKATGNGLENANLIFTDKYDSEIYNYITAEADAVEDMGCVPAGFVDNNAIGKLTIGKPGSAVETPENGVHVTLREKSTLYVHELVIGPNCAMWVDRDCRLVYGKAVIAEGGKIDGYGEYCQVNVPKTYTLTVKVEPSASGKVMGPGIDCRGDSGDCSETLAEGTEALLYAVPDESNRFDHWSGDLKGSATPASVIMSSSKSVTAHFVDKSIGKASDGKDHGKLDDPVNTATGELYFTLPLFDLGGPLPLSLDLYYGSAVNRKSDIDAAFGQIMGYNWLHSFCMARLDKGEQDTHIIYENGKILAFHLDSSTGRWASAAVDATAWQLRQAGGRFLLMDPEKDLVYTFGEDKRLKSIEDRNGNRITLAYDGNGLLAKAGDGLGRSLLFSYSGTTLDKVCDDGGRCFSFEVNKDGLMTGITDADGKVTKIEYDTGGQYKGVITRVVHPEGNARTVQTYDADGRVSTQADAKGNTTQLSIDAGTGLSTITFPDGATVEHAHAAEQYLTSYKDAAGNEAQIGYDTNNRQSSVTDRMGDENRIAYHSESGKVKAFVNAAGERTNYSYTAAKQSVGGAAFVFYDLTGILYPDGAAEKLTCDKKGNLIQRSDRAGGKWTYTYNKAGQMLTALNPAGGKQTFAYNADGTTASRKDSDTGTTVFQYDDHRRLAKVEHPGGGVLQITYDPMDRPASITDENGHIDRFVYDGNGNVTRWKDANGNTARFDFDAMDRPKGETDRTGRQVSFGYSKRGRLATVIRGDELRTSFGYDRRGWLKSVTRGDQTWKMGCDDEGIASSYKTPLGHTTAYDSNQLGSLAGVTDPLGNSTSIKRDAMNRVVSMTDPLSQTTTYGYDARGLLAKVSMPEIGKASYNRNPLGMVNKIKDPRGSLWSFQYTPMGRLKAFTDPLDRKTRLTCDARGRLARVEAPDGGSLDITYDAAGNVVRRLYSEGPDLNYAYDATDLPVSADGLKLTRDAEGRITATDDGNGVFGATYDAVGRLQTATYADGAFKVTYAYDAASGLLSSVTDNLAGARVSFTYDADGRPVKIARSNKVSTTLTWDEAGRLTRIQDGNIVDLEYTLDAAGRVTSVQGKTPLDAAKLLSPRDRQLTFDAASQASTEGYEYDALGRLTASPGPGRTFFWDGASRLKGVKDSGGRVNLGYDGLGNLTSRTEDGQTIRFQSNRAIGLAPIVAEKDESTGKWLRYYVWTPDGRLLYTIDAANTNEPSFHHFDRLGSTLALTGKAGTVTDAYAYDPYGTLLGHNGSSPQPFTFIGEWGVRQEGPSGTLYQMRARYYDTITSRFLSTEPLWPQIHHPGLLNPYQYALCNPMRKIDPTGLDPEDLGELERSALDKEFAEREFDKLDFDVWTLERLLSLYVDKAGRPVGFERIDQIRRKLEAARKKRDIALEKLREVEMKFLPRARWTRTPAEGRREEVERQAEERKKEQKEREKKEFESWIKGSKRESVDKLIGITVPGAIINSDEMVRYNEWRFGSHVGW